MAGAVDATRIATGARARFLIDLTVAVRICLAKCPSGFAWCCKRNNFSVARSSNFSGEVRVHERT